jgi:hypothetical protein
MTSKNKKTLPEIVTWKASDIQHHQRPAAWYMGLAIVSIGLIGFALYNHSIIMLITFVLIVFVIFILSLQPSRLVTYKITRTGVAIGRVNYPYQVIKKFWIAYNPPETKTLNLETTAYLNNRVIIQLGNQDPIEVKLYLSHYLEEDLDRIESFSESLARSLKI